MLALLACRVDSGYPSAGDPRLHFGGPGGLHERRPQRPGRTSTPFLGRSSASGSSPLLSPP
eukprot:8585633-Alexandrium_andersonii.AAC.1